MSTQRARSSSASPADDEEEVFYTQGLALPHRFWYRLEKAYDLFFDLIRPPKWVEPVIDLEEYRNASPPILGSMMSEFQAKGRRVRLSGEVISSCIVRRKATIRTVDGVEVAVDEARIAGPARFVEFEGRVVSENRLRAYGGAPIPDDFCPKLAKLVIEASMQEKFWEELPPGPLDLL